MIPRAQPRCVPEPNSSHGPCASCTPKRGAGRAGCGGGDGQALPGQACGRSKGRGGGLNVEKPGSVLGCMGGSRAGERTKREGENVGGHTVYKKGECQNNADFARAGLVFIDGVDRSKTKQSKGVENVVTPRLVETEGAAGCVHPARDIVLVPLHTKCGSQQNVNVNNSNNNNRKRQGVPAPNKAYKPHTHPHVSRFSPL